MSSVGNDLSKSKGSDVPDASAYKFGIVCAEWNERVTLAMKNGAHQTLVKHGADPRNIHVHTVPGSFELTLGAQWMLESADVDAVICIGCVIQGETRHFDFICQSVADGITQLNMKYSTPVVFGVLTTENENQALERAGGKHGNKGDEAAITAIKMLALKNSF